MIKTRIICTLGPATDKPGVLREMIESGMNVARLNFSHGDHEEHARRIALVKQLREEMHLPIAILLDTKGPEVRTGDFADPPVMLTTGETFTLTTRQIVGDETQVSITYKDLPKDVKPGARILVDDGLIELEAKRVTEEDIICQVINGGALSNKKSINLPGIMLNLPYISEKDEADIIFGVEQGVDFIAASFCRSAYDVLDVKRILEQHHGENINVIAKLENSDGVRNLEEILKVSDGIMVARGDLGVEIPFDELPIVQKKMIKRSLAMGKRVITATQMLDSMIKNPRPTRAEVSDVANAVYDGTSAIMLSGETAMGAYPVESVRTMARIACRAESDIDYIKRFNQQKQDLNMSVTNAISHATCTTAHDLSAVAIITFTISGRTAKRISSFRPACPIIACTTLRQVYHQLALSWGVTPALCTEMTATDEMFDQAVESAVATGQVKNGDLLVITAGIPIGVTGNTNILKVHIVGNVLVKGLGVNRLSVSGQLCVAHSAQEVQENFNEGDILVVPRADERMMPALKKARAIITEQEGMTNLAAIVGLTRDIPVICGAENATCILKSGTVVTVDAASGQVYSGVTRTQGQ